MLRFQPHPEVERTRKDQHAGDRHPAACEGALASVNSVDREVSETLESSGPRLSISGTELRMG